MLLQPYIENAHIGNWVAYKERGERFFGKIDLKAKAKDLSLKLALVIMVSRRKKSAALKNYPSKMKSQSGMEYQEKKSII